MDAIWGVVLVEQDEDAWNPQKWPGGDLVGFTLMAARGKIRKVTELNS